MTTDNQDLPDTLAPPAGDTQSGGEGSQETPPTPLSLEDQLVASKRETAAANEKATKAENDLRSARGREAPMRSLDAKMDELIARQNGTDKGMNLLSRSLASGNTDSLPGQLDQVQQETAQQRTHASFVTSYTTLSQDLEKLNRVDASGTDLVNFETDPRFESWRSDWIRAKNSLDFAALTTAGAKAERLLGEIKLENLNKSHEAETKKTSEEMEGLKKRLKGVNPANGDISSPPASNPGALDNLSPHEKIAQGLRREQDTGQRSTIWSVTPGS